MSYHFGAVRILYAALLVSSLGIGGTTRAMTFGDSANPPITQTINVQFIDVCGPTGTGCAPTSMVRSYETFADAIFAQAGTAFAFNSTITKLKLAATPCGGVTAVSTFCSDATQGLFDTVHTLVDTPGHGQSPVANTLNVYLANRLIQTTNGAPTSSNIYGWGLIGGNGAVIQTGTNSSGLVASPDVLAHELGHNLGLIHTDQPPINDPSPFNLMNTGTRSITTQVCAVTPYTCAGSPQTGRDQITAAEKPTIEASPLLNELASVSAFQFQNVGQGVSEINESYDTLHPNQTALVGGQLRYLGNAEIPTVLQACDINNVCHFVSLSLTQVGGNNVVTYKFSPLSPPNGSFGPQLIFQTGLVAPIPFSIDFSFANGDTSRAGFDGTGFRSQEGQDFSFNPFAPGVVLGPSILPMTGVPEDVSFNGSTPSDVLQTQPPLSFSGSAVPEPGTLALLSTCIAGMLLFRRRRRRRGAPVAEDEGSTWGSGSNGRAR